MFLHFNLLFFVTLKLPLEMLFYNLIYICSFLIVLPLSHTLTFNLKLIILIVKIFIIIINLIIKNVLTIL